jgi:hypothetical protein
MKRSEGAAQFSRTPPGIFALLFVCRGTRNMLRTKHCNCKRRVMTARKEHATSRVGHHVQILVVVCPAVTAAPLSTEHACGAVSPTLKRR